MKNWAITVLLLLVSSGVTIHAVGVTAYHKVRPGETLWFIAQVYYGNGYDYAKIMTANHLLSPDSVVAGQEVSIPDPQWVETMPKFAAHYAELASQREVALEKQRVSRGIASEEADDSK